MLSKFEEAFHEAINSPDITLTYQDLGFESRRQQEFFVRTISNLFVEKVNSGELERMMVLFSEFTGIAPEDSYRYLAGYVKYDAFAYEADEEISSYVAYNIRSMERPALLQLMSRLI